MTRLSSIKASDIMQKKVAQLSSSDSIDTAVALFERYALGNVSAKDLAAEYLRQLLKPPR